MSNINFTPEEAKILVGIAEGIGKLINDRKYEYKDGDHIIVFTTKEKADIIAHMNIDVTPLVVTDDCLLNYADMIVTTDKLFSLSPNPIDVYKNFDFKSTLEILDESFSDEEMHKILSGDNDFYQ